MKTCIKKKMMLITALFFFNFLTFTQENEEIANLKKKVENLEKRFGNGMIEESKQDPLKNQNSISIRPTNDTSSDGYQNVRGVQSIAIGGGSKTFRYGLAKEEYEKLSDTEKAKYEKVTYKINYGHNGATNEFYELKNASYNDNPIAIGIYSAAANAGIAFGEHATALGKTSIAIGSRSNSERPFAISIGNNAKAGNWGTAIGNWNKSGEQSISLGFGTENHEGGNYSVTIGSYSSSKSPGTVALGYHAIISENAKLSTALGHESSVLVQGGVALGAYSVADVSGNKFAYHPLKEGNFNSEEEIIEFLGIDRGIIEKLDNDIIEKQRINEEKNAEFEAARIKYNRESPEFQAARIASNEAADNLDKAVEKRHEYFKAYKSGTGTAPGTEAARNVGAVSVGSKLTTRQIVNVAGGTEDSDAVNVGQLKGAVKLTKNLQNSIGLSDEEINKINDKNIPLEEKPKTIVERIDLIKQEIGNSNDNLMQLNKQSSLALSGVSTAIAMSNLPQISSNLGYKNQISAGIGIYGGESALALGISGLSKKEILIYKVSGGINTKGNLAFGLGLAYNFGKKETDVKNENEILKQRLEKAELKIKELEDRINTILNSK